MTDVSAILADARELDDALQDSFVALEGITSRLLDRGRIEGALATLNDSSFSLFTHEVQNRFPRTAQRYIGSIHSALLSSFAANLPDAIPASKGELSGRLNECWRAVVLARPVLSEIALMYPKTTLAQADFRVKPFSDLGVNVPSTPRELSMLEGEILRDQKGVLQCFLEVLRGPARVDVLSQQRELRKLEAADVHPPSGSTVNSGTTLAPEVDPPTGASHAVPETGERRTASNVANIPRAAFYSENAEGFGEWEVFVTDHANADLRKLRKDSKDVFLMVLKKIRHLSRGRFSSDNQAPVADTEKGVPIFKAKVGGAHRLVYQVDSVNDPTSGDAYQALRIFGVYNHAELHRMGKFWEAVSKDLGRQGKTYRIQCRARSQPRRTGNDVFDPVKFYQFADRRGENEELHEPMALTNLEDKDYETILSMHRQVVFSKALLNSFFAGRDVAFMYWPSQRETEIIEHPSSCYVIGRSGTGKTLTMMYKIVSVERGWWTSSWDLPRPRQLFVTRSGMLSRQVQRTVTQILESFKLGDLTQEELVDIWRRQAEPAEHCRPLPAKWSKLEDGHFPLLISFDKLRELLEADFAGTGSFKTQTSKQEDDELDDSTSFISATRFIATYWDHFPKSVVKGLDPASVFGEIMGVIKGSEGTVDTARGYLDREAYLKLSPRSQPTFAAMRDRVYDVFERYLSLKRQRNERDDANRTHDLISLLKANGLPGRPVEFLFNDEAQDNLIIDMLLLRSLCNNPNGLCWAGDTAQTIALGSSFKFSELKSTMYRIEKSNLNPNYWHSYTVPPRMFHLAVNYRSHAGIITCAQTVVDLLTTLWPESIDRLSPDQGWREGPKPKFVKRSGFQELFQFSDKDTIIVPSEFSSEQCIIVRDGASRKALFSHGTPGGQVMTVYQSKGLEFNDVFLWHFFESSEPSEREWQSVCELFRGNPMQSHKTLDQYRNVCRELKALYVAITRARNRLFIIEDSDKSDPMLTLWTEKGEVEVTETSIAIDVPQEPDTEGWAKQGRIHMDKQNFEQAEYAFQRAGLERERRIAHAHLDREVAVAEEEFRKVALSFECCAKLSLGMPDHKELIVFAAVCYSRARAFTDSAQLYYSVSEYTKCTQQCCKASMMEDARQVILEHKNDINESVVKKVCVHFLDQHKYRPVEQLFKDQDELIEFMKRHNLPHLADYLESLQRFRESAEVYLSLNKIIKAIELFFRDDQATSVARGTARLLGELWCRYTLGQPVDKGSKDFKKLNDLLSCRKGLLDRHPLPPLEESEIRMLLLIISRRSDDLLELGNKLRPDGHRGFALLSFDYALMFLLEEGPPETVQRMVDDFTIFHVFRAYTALIKSHRDEARTSQIFGIDKGRSDSYILLKGTLLYESAHAEKGHDVAVIAGTDGLTINQSALLRLLRRTLDNRLHSRFWLLGKTCKTFGILQPCISYCLSGDCIDSSCRWKHREGPQPLDEQGIHRRIHLLCQVIITYGILDVNTKAHSVWDARLDWMYLLSNSLHVPFFALGTPLMFHSRLVPKFSEACRVANTWISELLYSAPAEGSPHSIPSPEIRSRAIPCAAPLGYMLDNLRDRLQTTSGVAPLEAWYYYGPSYRNHLQHLREYQAKESPRSQMPGALLYLRFLLDGRSQGREAIITHIAEGLATAFILAKPVSDHRALHNIVLGRGWLGTLVDLWNSPVMPPSHDEGHIEDFVKLLYPLLRMLCTRPTGPAGLLLPSEDQLSNEISRVVIAWFLVGYSLELPEQIRSFIVNTIKRIPERLRPLHLQRIVYGSRASCASYVNHARKTLFHAESGWDDLEHAVWCSNGPATNLNPARQLIHVQKEGIKAEHPMDTPGTVVPITYKGLNSLLPLLFIRSPPRPPTPFPPEWRLPKPRPIPLKSKGVVRPMPVPCFGGQLRPQVE